jgi:histidyl-tRNA synthetase
MRPARISPVSFLKLSADVASFYGFRNLREVGRSLKPAERPRVSLAAPSFSATAQLCAAAERTSQDPTLLFYATPSPTALHTRALLENKHNETGEFGLCVVGTKESIAEVTIIKTISTIATEWGVPLARVRLNALGDRDSRERYTRELISYVRRRAQEFEPACREALLSDPFAAHHCTHERCRALLAEGPRSLTFLSEKSRAHFREILERVEGLGFDYELDDLLVGDEREQHIVFALDLREPDATIVGSIGGRWDEYLRRLGGRPQRQGSEGGAVSASIFFRKKGAGRGTFSLSPKSRAPKIFFVQLGARAKLQGLAVLEMLRRARIPVSQSFDSSRLSPQLSAAGGSGVSYVLIMGQREALDGTVILRETKNSSQTIIEISHLPRVLKSLRS